MNLAPETDEFQVWTDEDAADHISQFRVKRRFDPISFMLGAVVASAVAWGLWCWWGVLHG